MLVHANLIVATNNNIAGIEKSLMDTAKLVFEKDGLKDLILPDPLVKT